MFQLDEHIFSLGWNHEQVLMVQKSGGSPVEVGSLFAVILLGFLYIPGWLSAGFLKHQLVWVKMKLPKWDYVNTLRIQSPP